jgi:hypothetical protein
LSKIQLFINTKDFVFNVSTRDSQDCLFMSYNQPQRRSGTQREKEKNSTATAQRDATGEGEEFNRNDAEDAEGRRV